MTPEKKCNDAFIAYCQLKKYCIPELLSPRRERFLVERRIEIVKFLRNADPSFSYTVIGKAMNRDQSSIRYLHLNDYREHKKQEYLKRKTNV